MSSRMVMNNNKKKYEMKPHKNTPPQARKPLQGVAINIENAAEALYEARGIISHAAEMIGCNRGTLVDLIEKHDSLKEALHDSRERRLDEIERAAYQRARDLSCPNVQKFILSTLGAKRGYAPQAPTQTNSLDALREALDWVNRNK